MLCACPPAAAIGDISTDECKENIGQVQKIGLQRRKDGTALNWITIATSDPALLATWTALKAAVDNTKVQFTPFIQNPTSETGEAIEFGGGNATVSGIPLIVGRNPSTFEAQFLQVKQTIIKEIKAYECEAELSVFLINEAGDIICIADDPVTPTQVRGIPIRSFFVSDKRLGGFEEPDSNTLSWGFEPNWSDNLTVVSPTDFDALSQL
jgi:hypothetical protein